MYTYSYDQFSNNETYECSQNWKHNHYKTKHNTTCIYLWDIIYTYETHLINAYKCLKFQQHPTKLSYFISEYDINIRQSGTPTKIFCMSHGPISIRRLSFPGMGIPMLKVRWSWDRLFFNMWIPVLVRWHLYIETAPRSIPWLQMHWFLAWQGHTSVCKGLRNTSFENILFNFIVVSLLI